MFITLELHRNLHTLSLKSAKKGHLQLNRHQYRDKPSTLRAEPSMEDPQAHKGTHVRLCTCPTEAEVLGGMTCVRHSYLNPRKVNKGQGS